MIKLKDYRIWLTTIYARVAPQIIGDNLAILSPVPVSPGFVLAAIYAVIAVVVLQPHSDRARFTPGLKAILRGASLMELAVRFLDFA